MKKVLILLSISMLFSLLAAVDFDYSGEIRHRGAFWYDDNSEDLDNGMDTRFRLNMDAAITRTLSINTEFEVGDFTWYDGNINNFQVEANEAYIDYRWESMAANFKVGKQYWADHRGLVMDDYFTGIMMAKDDLAGFKTELGLLKYNINFGPSTWWLAHMQSKGNIPMGFTAMAGYVDGRELLNVSVMPYVTLDVAPMTIDITPFFDFQSAREETGFGVAVKVDAELDQLELGADLLFAGENGLTTVSPWYQNGLYLYGIGEHNDGLNHYWNTPYQYNGDTFMSLVAKMKYALTPKAQFFAAAGLLTDTGMELNGGLRYQIIPEKFSAATYAAFGSHDTPEQMDVALGGTLQVNF